MRRRGVRREEGTPRALGFWDGVWLAAFLAACLLVLAPAALAAVRMAPPPQGMDRRFCMDCHRMPNLAGGEGVAAANSLCMECHGNKAASKTVAGVKVSEFVNLKDFAGTGHQRTACLQCHVDVARSPHKSLSGAAQCLSCHPPHGDGLIGDPHLRVRCQACHNQSKLVALDPKTGVVGLAGRNAAGKAISLASHKEPDLTSNELCLRCHVPRNAVGAAAMVLPKKGLICFMCHPASLSLGSWWFAAALAVFLLGLIVMVSFWMKGEVAGEHDSLHNKIARGSDNLWRTVFSREFWGILKAVVLDVILQRRLLKESVQRWFFHTLIYWAILARMALGLFTWLAYQAAPASSLAGALIDKNQGFVAAANDLLGLLLLAGVVLAALQRVVFRPKHVDTSATDAIALALLGVLSVLGFVLEAARLLLSHLPPEVQVYAFVSYPLSRLLAGIGGDWTVAYAWLWYAHGIVAAAFVAYLPFGKMRHVFAAPLSLIINRKLR